MEESVILDKRNIKAGACFIIQGNFKIFAHAILSLNRIGEELYIEPCREGLIIRTMSAGKSAYASFVFSPAFFSSCTLENIDNSCNLCRVSMKCALSAFKCVRSNDKMVVSCRMYINPLADSMLIQLTYTYDVVKSHLIAFHECTSTFKSNINRAEIPNCIIASSKLLFETFSRIGQDNKDVILSAQDEHYVIKNFINVDQDANKIMKTEARIPVNLFDLYNVPNAVDITVNLKDLKAMVNFANIYQAPVSIYFFEECGKPMVLALERDVNFSAELVVATVDNEVLNFDHSLIVRDDQNEGQSLTNMFLFDSANVDFGNHKTKEKSIIACQEESLPNYVDQYDNVERNEQSEAHEMSNIVAEATNTDLRTSELCDRSFRRRYYEFVDDDDEFCPESQSPPSTKFRRYFFNCSQSSIEDNSQV